MMITIKTSVSMMEVEVVWDEQTERKKKKETSSAFDDDQYDPLDDGHYDSRDDDHDDDSDDNSDDDDEDQVPTMVHIWSEPELQSSCLNSQELSVCRCIQI